MKMYFPKIFSGLTTFFSVFFFTFKKTFNYFELMKNVQNHNSDISDPERGRMKLLSGSFNPEKSIRKIKTLHCKIDVFLFSLRIENSRNPFYKFIVLRNRRNYTKQ